MIEVFGLPRMDLDMLNWQDDQHTSTEEHPMNNDEPITDSNGDKPKTFFVPGMGDGHYLEGYEVGTPEHTALIERERERRHREDGTKAEAFITRKRSFTS